MVARAIWARRRRGVVEYGMPRQYTGAPPNACHLNGDAVTEFTLSPTGVAEQARMRCLSPFEAPAFDFNDLELVRVGPVGDPAG
jgi:hypothetical protein